MKRVGFLLLITLFLSVSTIFAQQKSANFLGVWKLVKSESKRANKSLTLSVTQTGNDLVIERSSPQVNSTNTSLPLTETYKVTESAKVSLASGRFGGVVSQQLRFFNEHKLQLLSEANSDNFTTSIRETWVLSEDGKTLTIKSDFRMWSKTPSVNDAPGYTSTKMVFTRQ